MEYRQRRIQNRVMWNAISSRCLKNNEKECLIPAQAVPVSKEKAIPQRRRSDLVKNTRRLFGLSGDRIVFRVVVRECKRCDQSENPRAISAS